MFAFHSLIISLTGEVQNCIMSLFSKWEQSSSSWGMFVIFVSPFIDWIQENGYPLTVFQKYYKFSCAYTLMRRNADSLCIKGLSIGNNWP
jgi:hypothetical protein